MRKGKNGDKEGWKLLAGGLAMFFFGWLFNLEGIMCFGIWLLVILFIFFIVCWLGGSLDFMDF